MTNKELLSRAISFDGGPAIYANGYVFISDYYDDPFRRFTIEARDGFNGRKWAVCDSGGVFSKKDKDFIYEVLPSSRTDEFIEDTRFDKVTEAFAALEAWKVEKRKALIAAGWEIWEKRK